MARSSSFADGQLGVTTGRRKSKRAAPSVQLDLEHPTLDEQIEPTLEELPDPEPEPRQHLRCLRGLGIEPTRWEIMVFADQDAGRVVRIRAWLDGLSSADRALAISIIESARARDVEIERIVARFPDTQYDDKARVRAVLRDTPVKDQLYAARLMLALAGDVEMQRELRAMDAWPK